MQKVVLMNRIIGGIGLGALTIATVGGLSYLVFNDLKKEDKPGTQVEQVIDYKSKYETLLTDYNLSEANLKSKQTELASAKAEVESLTQDKNALQAKLTASETKVDTLSKEKAELQKEVDAVNASLTEITTERDNLQNQLNAKDNEINSLTEQISTKDATIEQLTQDKASLQEQINNYTNQITTLQSENEVLNGNIGTLNDSITEKNNQIDELNATITTLQNELDALKQAVGGYTIEQVNQVLSLNFFNEDKSLNYCLSNGDQRTGSDLKSLIGMTFDNYEINDNLQLDKNGIGYSVSFSAERYEKSSDTETQPASITINNNVADLNTLDDNLSYNVEIVVNEIQLYEGTSFIKTATFYITISSVATMDKLSFETNEDNASYCVEALNSNIEGDVVIPEFYNGLPVTLIRSNAFYNCANVTSITIPNSVTSIEYGAFSACSNLTSITIPESVTSIGSLAFYYCYSLKSITIPEGVTSIKERTFSGCEGLTSITIPESVTSIDDFAFAVCESLTSVTIKATTPPSLSSSSEFSTERTIYYVPAESLETYKTADGWSDYADKIQAIEE